MYLSYMVLKLSTVEDLRIKCQLTKTINGLVDIPPDQYNTSLHKNQVTTLSQVQTSSSLHQVTTLKIATSQGLYVIGIPFQPLWRMLPAWYSSSGSLASCHSKSVWGWSNASRGDRGTWTQNTFLLVFKLSFDF